MKRLTPKILFIAGFLSLGILAAQNVIADVYSFEVILFERPGGGSGEHWPGSPGEPDRALATGGNIGALPRAGRSLGPVAYTLQTKGMKVLKHLAWAQQPRGRNSNTWYWLGGDRLNGLIRVTRGRFLHLETDLVLREAGSARPFRIKLHRRMRSGELHYVDHPKLGILIKAERHRAAAKSDGATGPASGEPKPAKPLGEDKPS